MKVKIFNNTSTDSLEIDMNDWFKENSNIEIKEIKQSSAQSHNMTIRTVVSIFYVIKSKPQDFGPG